MIKLIEKENTMKNIKYILAVLMLTVGSASAASLEFLQVKELDKKASAKYLTYNDAVSLNIHYVGTSTQAIVYVSSGVLTTYVPGPSGTQDLNYNLAAAAYDTMGEVCDAIDADGDYTCSLIDAKRDDSSILTQNSAISNSDDLKAAGGFDVKIDSGCVELDDGTQFVLRLGITPASGKAVVLKYCKFINSGTDVFNIWGKLAKYAGVSDGVTRNDTTKIYGPVTADNTATTEGDVYGGNWLEFGKDEHVVIGSSVADTAQAAEDYLTCVWDEK